MPLRSALFLVAIAVAGCTSARDVYRGGMDREVAGDYPAAADAYINALERDRGLQNVPGRLAVAGRQAVRVHLGRAAVQDPVEAAHSYRAAARLVRRAAAVGVRLDHPATFEADLRAAEAGAVDALAGHASARLAAQDYPGVLSALDQARAFGPDAGQSGVLDGLALRAYDGWARADLAAGRFRAALAHTEAALRMGGAPEVYGPLRLDVLDAGAVVGAVLPVEAADDVPRWFARDLFDALSEDALAPSPAPFVVLADPVEVRRWDRHGPRSPVFLSDSPRRLADAARDLGADVGVVVYLSDVRDVRRVGEPEEQTARTRRGPAATYTRRRVDLTVTAHADLVAVDAAGRPVCERSVERRVVERYSRASFDGDLAALDLTRVERRAFSGDVDEAARDRALLDLRDALAAALGDEVVGCLGGLVR